MNLEYVNNILVLSLFMLSVLNKSQHDRLAIFLLVIITCGFNLVADKIPAAYMTFYYVGAALNDLLIIYALSRISKTTKLIINLQRLCIGFVLINLIGWILYMLYVPSIQFSLMYTVMYAGILLTILTGGGYGLGNNAMDSRGFSFFGNHPSRGYITPSYQTKTRL